MRALVEKYFCISQSGISRITRVLLWQQKRGLQRGFGEGVGTKPKSSIPVRRRGRRRLFVELSTLWDDRMCSRENKCVAGETTRDLLKGISGRLNRRESKRKEEKSRFFSTAGLQHTRRSITLERNESFPRTECIMVQSHSGMSWS